jgi:hypothetical protein
MRIAILAVTGILMISQQAQACMFDTDCYPGSECLKKSGSLYGVCAGGINPGNDYDDQPVYAPTDPAGTYGNTCMFDVDCGPGNACLKSGLNGVCVKD